MRYLCTGWLVLNGVQVSKHKVHLRHNSDVVVKQKIQIRVDTTTPNSVNWTIRCILEVYF